MLARRSCHDCGRQVRLSITIEPPRCPACRLAYLPPLVETRPCLGCSVPIPVNSQDLHCGHCRTRPSPQPLLNNRPCYDCGTPFLARTRIIRCFDCRSRRSTIMQAPVDYDRLRTTTFDPFVNSFQRPHNAGESVLES
jgi:DNA-directed RNA polymerase subunit RPC12/RpoP